MGFDMGKNQAGQVNICGHCKKTSCVCEERQTDGSYKEKNARIDTLEAVVVELNARLKKLEEKSNG
jgi:hypothetical protein